MLNARRCHPAIAALFATATLGAQNVAVLGDLCSGGDATGTGLRAAYYTDTIATSQPVLIGLDSAIDFPAISANNRKIPPGAEVKAVRWCGWIRPVMSGEHHFPATAADMQVAINKQVVTDARNDKVMAIDLQAGQVYAITIEVRDVAQAGNFSLQWTPPFGVTYAIPPSVLFPPVETVNPGC